MLWGWFALALVSMFFMWLCVTLYNRKRRVVYKVSAVACCILFVVILCIAFALMIDLLGQCEAKGARVECNSAFSAEGCYCVSPVGVFPMVL